MGWNFLSLTNLTEENKLYIDCSVPMSWGKGFVVVVDCECVESFVVLLVSWTAYNQCGIP